MTQPTSRVSGLPPALQNRNVLIGIGAAVVLLIIVVMVLMFRPQPTATETFELDDAGAANSAALDTPQAGIDGAAPGMSGITAPVDAMGMGAAPGAAGMPGAAPQAAAQPAPPNQPPGVSTRSNAFTENKDLRDVIASVQTPPENVAASHSLYAELNPPEARPQISTDDQEGPPPPPMRLVGVIYGSVLSAMLQMGSEYIRIKPGAMIPSENPVYRVERIEPDKVILTRRWEMGNRKGVQRIEVPLATSAAPPPMPVGGAMPGGGGPGSMPGGYGGPPGAPQTAGQQ